MNALLDKKRMALAKDITKAVKSVAKKHGLVGADYNSLYHGTIGLSIEIATLLFDDHENNDEKTTILYFRNKLQPFYRGKK